jgi:Na+-translocating ferredoxin:NAD+ oxidoreductase subunit G
MKKLESTFKNMVLVLSGISIFAAGALGLVNDMTKEPIRLAELAGQEAAIRKVTPAFDNSPVKEQYPLVTPEGDSITCYPAKKNGRLVGVAIKSYSSKGYGGRMEIMVGLKTDGSIFNYSVLKHAETPGLGSKMNEWFRTDKNKQSVLGLNPGKDKVWVAKDGGDVDAITAATISSRAFLDAVDRAYRSYMNSENVRVDAQSAASQDYSTKEGEGTNHEK